MTESTKILSIIAYYLSEYDMKAVKALGYQTRSEAFKQISVTLGRDNNYLKLRRDEFDALPESSSSRKGWRNRPAAKDVIELAAYLHYFSFDQLTEICKALIENLSLHYVDFPPIEQINDDNISEDALELSINSTDPTANILFKNKNLPQRVYRVSIIKALKLLNKGVCQICGLNPAGSLNIDICEAHHIEYFSKTHNNDTDNILIVCPNHHRMIHKMDLAFDRNTMSFCKNGIPILTIKILGHLNTNESERSQ